jgi:hypothetical protein
MEWLISLAIVPVLLCGLMCVVPIALAAVGLRRRTTQRGADGEAAPASRAQDRAEPASR